MTRIELTTRTLRNAAIPQDVSPPSSTTGLKAQAAPRPARVDKVYLKNLNGLRFFAALCVIVHHIEQIKRLVGWPHAYDNPVIRNMGGLAVTFFFVLSGFLITYLLLCEKSWTGRVDVGGFYIRRVLRIWPLYLIITLFAFLIVPYLPFLPPLSEPVGATDYYWKLALFLCFLPNLSLAAFPPVPYASQAWSIGVEEQFYLIWPLLMAFSRRVFAVMAAIVVAFLILKTGVHLLYTFGPKPAGLVGTASRYLNMTLIDCMALGGLMAHWLLYGSERWTRLIFQAWLQGLVVLLLAALLLFNVRLSIFQQEVFAVLFALLIANVSLNPKTRVNMEHPLLAYLGSISYGLYMYHPLAIGLALSLLMGLGLHSGGLELYGLTLILCIAIASASYELIEKRFLRLKSAFTTIVSGEQARDKEATHAA